MYRVYIVCRVYIVYRVVYFSFTFGPLVIANILIYMLLLFPCSSEERLKDGGSGDLVAAVAMADPVQDNDEED